MNGCAKGGAGAPDATAPARAGLPVVAVNARIFNVKYSPNLGDGLLSEALETALIACGADPDTRSVDLAARRQYGDALAGRASILAGLDALPQMLRGQVVRLPLAIQARRKWSPHYRNSIGAANCAVIGGGNLVSDLDLNFPTKLGLVMRELDAQRLPVVVYGVGVTRGWSRRGLRMFREAFARRMLRAVFVRDEESRRNWDAALADITGLSAHVVRDPGLLASDTHYVPPRNAQQRPMVGIGLISHIAIKYHSAKAPGQERLDAWYIALAKGLIEAGYRVAIFTNGTREDQIYRNQMRGRLSALGDADTVVFPQQNTPEELCRHIASFDLVIAYRMHAIIAAYSFGVPIIALAWDDKLRSFMRSVNQDSFLIDILDVNPAQCVALATRALATGIPQAERASVLADARGQVRDLHATLQRAVQA